MENSQQIHLLFSYTFGFCLAKLRTKKKIEMSHFLFNTKYLEKFLYHFAFIHNIFIFFVAYLKKIKDSLWSCLNSPLKFLIKKIDEKKGILVEKNPISSVDFVFSNTTSVSMSVCYKTNAMNKIV